MLNRKLFPGSLVALALFAQAGSALAQEAPARQATLRPATLGRSNVVEQEEIRAADAGPSAYEAIRRLRPEYLTRRATPEPGDSEEGFPVVYLDGVRLGGLETLKNIPLDTITRIRFLRASEAAQWLGRTHRGGVIAVSTIR
jgi:hypothetical protein